jgi:hypothetical protein
MKQEFVFGGLIALALSVGTAAQTAYPTSQDKDKDKDKDMVTVTGCLVPGAGGAVGTSGTTSDGHSVRQRGVHPHQRHEGRRARRRRRRRARAVPLPRRRHQRPTRGSRTPSSAAIRVTCRSG